MAWHRPGDKPLTEPKMDWVINAYMHHLELKYMHDAKFNKPPLAYCSLVTPCGDIELGQHWLR